MSAAGNSATDASTGNFGDEGNMAEAGRRVWVPDIALATGLRSAQLGQPANRQMAQARGRVADQLPSARGYSVCEFVTAP
jgi:hypothetical protein